MGQKPDLTPESEVRLAVVMYGGVSLAVYMNGVTQELLRLAQATAPDPQDRLHALYADDDLPGTALLYRQLARLPRSEIAPPGGSPDGPISRRFVIDILSGTSAGGINAVFLAKALACGQPLDDLARLWETDADLNTLINDAESRGGDMRDLPSHAPPRSLLNSDRMYGKLLAAFDGMDQTAPSSPPLVDQVDLFVTATDLEGLPINLELSGGEVAQERRHRKSFHLRRDERRNDFERGDNPFLAFISRCTSSFPVAFEPMQVTAAREVCAALHRPFPGGASIPDEWSQHFAEYPLDRSLAQRAFGDGGYLDNKPFSYAIDAIARQPGGDAGSVERKVLYIEPDPEQLPDKPEHAEKKKRSPTAVENALSVVSLRSYETIREDLLRLRDRNRLVERIRSVVAGVNADFEALKDVKRGERGALTELAAIIAAHANFRKRTLREVVQQFGPAYGGYHRLKVGQLTDDLSRIAARHLGILEDSDDFRALRLLARSWRNARYSRDPAEADDGRESEFAFLTDHDLAYRVRRLAFVIEQINQARVLHPLELAKEMDQTPLIWGGKAVRSVALEIPEELGRAFDEQRRELADTLRGLRQAREALFEAAPGGVADVIAQGAKVLRTAIDDVMAVRSEDRRWAQADRLGTSPELLDAWSAISGAITQSVMQAAATARKRCHTLLRTDGTPQLPETTPVPGTRTDVARYIARHYYTWYELYDLMVFPIVYGSEVGEELAPVEPLRISPLVGPDGTPQPKLLPTGLKLGHFGAFLDKRWRARDILIGRLNASEKLVRTILADTPQDQPGLVQEYVDRAHQAIIEEEFGRPGSSIREQIEAARDTKTPEQRLQYVRTEGLPQDEIAPKDAVGWIARSAKVLGQVFEDASDAPGVSKLARWLSLAGHFLSGMLEVVVPTQWWGLVLRRWTPRLALFGIALWVLGTLLKKEQVTSLGGTVLLLVAGFMVLTSLLGRWLKGIPTMMRRAITVVLAVALLILLAIGVSYLPDAWREVSHRVAALVGR